MSRTSPDQPTSRGSLTRRTALRTGAHAAWVVPVVTAVSAAPAFAVSLTTTTLTTSVAPAVRIGVPTANTMPVVGSVTNSGLATTTALRVQMTATVNDGAIDNRTFATAGDGCDLVGQTFTARAASFFFKAQAQLAAGATIAFRPTVVFNGTLTSGNITLVSSPGNGPTNQASTTSTGP